MIAMSIEVGTVAPAAEGVPSAQRREGGNGRVRGFGAAEQRVDVRHLVIFRAPVVGYARPAAPGAR